MVTYIIVCKIDQETNGALQMHEKPKPVVHLKDFTQFMAKFPNVNVMLIAFVHEAQIEKAQLILGNELINKYHLIPYEEKEPKDNAELLITSEGDKKIKVLEQQNIIKKSESRFEDSPKQKLSKDQFKPFKKNR